MLYAKGGNDHFEHGRAHVEAQRAEYIRTAYHKPADEYNEDWDLRGVQQDLSVYFSIGSELANSDAWPSWTDGNEFKAIRDETAGNVSNSAHRFQKRQPLSCCRFFYDWLTITKGRRVVI